MNFIRACFEECRGEFIEELQQAGFSVEQSGTFLTEAEQQLSMIPRVSDSSHVISDLLSSDARALLEGLDFDALVSRMGISSSQAQNAIDALVPVFRRKMNKKSEQMAGAVAAMDWSVKANRNYS